MEYYDIMGCLLASSNTMDYYGIRVNVENSVEYYDVMGWLVTSLNTVKLWNMDEYRGVV